MFQNQGTFLILTVAQSLDPFQFGFLFIFRLGLSAIKCSFTIHHPTNAVKEVSCLSGQSNGALCVFEEMLERLYSTIFPRKEKAASMEERDSC